VIELEQRIYDLINRSLENKISSEEKRELNEILTNDTEVKKYYDSLMSLSNKDIAEDNSLNTTDVHSKPESKKNIFAKFWDEILSSPGLRYSALIPLGILIGIFSHIAYQNVVNPNSVNIDKVVGTMADFPTLSGYEAGEEIVIEQDNISGTITTQLSDEIVIAEVNLILNENMRMDITFNQNALSVFGMKPILQDEKSNINWGSGLIRMEVIGENKYLLFFKKKDNPPKELRIKIYDDIRVVYENVIKVG
jgi:hypothetical protein